MSRTALRHLRLVGPLAVVAALGMGSLPALAQSAPSTADCSAIKFDLSNPGPGSRVEHGNAIVQGVAMDTRAGTGAGIDRIDFFLENRDTGGVSIGTTSPGTVPGPFGPGSFQATISFPDTVGGHDLFAYAHSSVTGQEAVIDVPIAVGEDPAKAEETTSTATQTCTKGGNTASTTAAMTPPATTASAATTPVATTTTTTAMAPSASTITLNVGNPSPGDTVHVGGLNVSGSAWDKAATSGSGIDRIDVFLDDRDAGGMLLTQANFGTMNNWTATLTLPSNQTGLHELVFYAHSSATGQQAVVSVPVTIAP